MEDTNPQPMPQPAPPMPEGGEGGGAPETPLHMETVQPFVAWCAVLSMAYFALLPAVLFV